MVIFDYLNHWLQNTYPEYTMQIQILLYSDDSIDITIVFDDFVGNNQVTLFTGYRHELNQNLLDQMKKTIESKMMRGFEA